MSIPRSKTNRSRVTNGKAVLAGIDGRTPAARRFRDIVDVLAGEIGENLTEAEKLQVRAAAALQVHVEELAARVIRGEEVDVDEMTRAGNAAIRALEAIKRKRQAKAPAKPTVRDYLASRGIA